MAVTTSPCETLPYCEPWRGEHLAALAMRSSSGGCEMARACVPELGQPRSLTTPVIGRRDLGRSMYHILSPVNTGREADHLLSIPEPIVCKEASILDVSSFPCTPILTFYKLL